jgi:hypothetical protein
MSFDAHKNFAITTVVSAPTPAASGTTIVVSDGTVFPAVPFNATIWPANVQPTAANAEVIRVTNIATNTLTVTRIQESSSARSILVGDQIADTITAKTLTDLETVLNTLVAVVSKSANYTATTSDRVILVTGTSTITLPTAVGDVGRKFDIKNVGTNTVTVGTTSAQTIDGASTYSMTVQYMSITVVSDGANWSVI